MAKEALCGSCGRRLAVKNKVVQVIRAEISSITEEGIALKGFKIGSREIIHEGCYDLKMGKK